MTNQRMENDTGQRGEGGERQTEADRQTDILCRIVQTIEPTIYIICIHTYQDSTGKKAHVTDFDKGHVSFPVEYIYIYNHSRADNKNHERA